MNKIDKADIRALEAVLDSMSSLNSHDQLRVLLWVIEKLDLSVDLKIALRNAKSKNRSVFDLAYELTSEGSSVS